ncbi:type I methionyl aminopeptidase [Epidermidibacterium keratini]|uniref:Methionine aminopeptidase n=1 Tax=Epidermidibacterium keratini TaxID=1891644 RepID=A0A7L4YQD2_9ACTN|nr:type I methionyl aminopeptidase [Epidermidibacterium keratini]QHC01366.1 type I methionyl aminopeptidase [Epidermidibacterium keratini]
MIEIKTDEQLALMRAAGLVVASALDEVQARVAPGVSTAELDAIAEQVIRDHGAVPSFLGYHGFTGSICASVGAEVVHGIPRPDRVLAEGELISVDCGAILDDWHGDSARTLPVGEITDAQRALLTVTENSMWAGIAAGAAGGRLSDISHAVESSIEAAAARDGVDYGIVEMYGGHGIGTAMHQDPHILNYGKPGRGPRLEPGMALAIEPMVTLGSAEVDELADGWTVVTRDGSDAAHFEHTYAITTTGPWVLTARDGGAAGLAPYGVHLSELAS